MTSSDLYRFTGTPSEKNPSAEPARIVMATGHVRMFLAIQRQSWSRANTVTTNMSTSPAGPPIIVPSPMTVGARLVLIVGLTGIPTTSWV